jgi:hypothetical protein
MAGQDGTAKSTAMRKATAAGRLGNVRSHCHGSCSREDDFAGGAGDSGGGTPPRRRGGQLGAPVMFSAVLQEDRWPPGPA